jgi:hypothetical protein
MSAETSGPQLFCRPSRITSVGFFCVYFRASAAGINHSLNSYPAFWSDDQREIELYIELGEKHLQLLDDLYQKGQIALLDNLLGEIEYAAKTKRQIESDKEFDEKTHSHASNSESGPS